MATNDSDEIDAQIEGLNDWRGTILGRARELIKDAVPDVEEEIKWRKPSNPGGVPTWSSGGIICTGEVYKAKVKLTFAQGASVDDPDGIFNSSLEARTRRAIDLAEGDTLNATKFKALVKRAAKHNAS